MSKQEGLIYFRDGELVAEHKSARVYLMNDELFLEIGSGHTLWALQSEISDYIDQLRDWPTGDVLEIGLGLGVASRYLLTFNKVKSLTTVELNEDVVAVHAQIRDRLYTDEYIKAIKSKQHVILNTDGLIYMFTTKYKYDFIFLDFYDRIDEDTLPLIKDMANGCRKVLNPGGVAIGWLDPHTPDEFVYEFEKIFPIRG
jgi:spermidine synthase